MENQQQNNGGGAIGSEPQHNVTTSFGSSVPPPAPFPQQAYGVQPPMAENIPPKKPSHRKRWLIIGGIFGLLLIVGGIVWWLFLGNQSKDTDGQGTTNASTSKVIPLTTSLSALSLKSSFIPSDSTVRGWILDDTTEDTIHKIYTSADDGSRISSINGVTTKNGCNDDRGCIELYAGSYYRVTTTASGASTTDSTPVTKTTEVKATDGTIVTCGTYDFTYKKSGISYKERVVIRATPAVFVLASYRARDSSRWEAGANTFVETLTLDIAGGS
jgi:hypothetical protein